jgi:predicted RNA-binding Zn ribbon-like protein
MSTTFDMEQHDTAPSAPGELELLQRFLNLHVHDAEGVHRDPPAEMVGGFLVARHLLRENERFSEADRETYLELRDAMRKLIEAVDDEPVPRPAAEAIDGIGLAAGLHPHFHATGAPTLEPKGHGVAAAFGKIVAIAFVSAFDGSFAHLKLCADETCRSVFYDRSKNHSGRWCSMATCGNRAKVRAWRERQRDE